MIGQILQSWFCWLHVSFHYRSYMRLISNLNSLKPWRIPTLTNCMPYMCVWVCVKCLKHLFQCTRVTCENSIKTIVSPANALFACTPTFLLQTLFVYAIRLSAAICSCRLSRPGSMCGTAGQGLLEAVCDDVGSRLKQGRCVAPDKEIWNK